MHQPLFVYFHAPLHSKVTLMTCCGVTYLLIATLAMIATFVSLWLPFVLIVDNLDGSSDDARGSTNHMTAFLRISKTPASSAHNLLPTSRHMLKEELTLSDDALQCPFLNGPCYLGSTELSIDGFAVQTDDVVAVAGCSSLGSMGDPTKARLWTIVASFWSVLAWLMAIFHTAKGAKLGAHAGAIKFGAAALSGLHCGSCAAAAGLESVVTSCVMSSAQDALEIVPGSYTITMVSLIALGCGGGLQFWNAIGMIASWFTSCCGAPAGRDCATLVRYHTQNMYEQQLSALSPTSQGSQYLQ